MKGYIRERIDIAEKIADGTYSKEKAERAMDALQEKYPEKAFGKYFSFTKKEHPWTKEYLEELKDSCLYGVVTREFMSFMAEVSDEVYRAKRIKKAVLTAALFIAAVVLVVLFAKTLISAGMKG